MNFHILRFALFLAVASVSPAFAQTPELINTLIVAHQTATLANADTEDGFTLRIEGAGGPLPFCSRTFPSQSHDEREKGRVDTYTFNVADCRLELSKVDAQKIWIISRGKDAWLPASFNIRARTNTGREVLLMYIVWPSRLWFSGEASDIKGLPAGSQVAPGWLMSAASVRHTLYVLKTGQGTIRGLGIDCGSNCQEEGLPGSLTSLTASPVPGWMLRYWQGCEWSSGSVCMARRTMARTEVKAVFERAYTVTIQKIGSGFVSGNLISPNVDRIACEPTCSGRFLANTRLLLTAAPAPGWVFSGWTLCPLPNANPCDITVTSDRTVTAMFVPAGGTPPPPPQALFNAQFTSSADGFVYQDDAFRGTTQPTYANGTYLATGGFSGGGLQVELGGQDYQTIVGMSGGWTRTFTLAAPKTLTLSFRYNLTQTSEYDPDEVSQVLVSLDGTLVGRAPNDYVAQVVGDGNGGAPTTTGWQLVTLTIPNVAAGQHQLRLGGYNNKKTAADETTTVRLDDVLLQ